MLAPAGHLFGAIGDETTRAAPISRQFPAGHLFGAIARYPLLPPPVLFENELADYLRSQIGVNPYPNKLPQSNTVYPLLSFTVVDGSTDMLMSGPSGLIVEVVQFDAWSPVATQVYTIAKQLRTLLGTTLFEMFSGGMGRIQVLNVTPGRPMSASYPPVNGQDSRTMYRSMIAFEFQYKNP